MVTQRDNTTGEEKTQNEVESSQKDMIQSTLTLSNLPTANGTAKSYAIEDLAQNFANLNLDDFRKEGFYLALSPEEEPLTNRLLGEKIRERLQRGNNVKQQIAVAVRAQIAHGNSYRNTLKDSINPLTQELDKHLQEIPQLLQKIDTIRLEIKTITTQITAVKYAISKALTTLIPDRIDQLKIELAKLAECYHQISEAKNTTNRASFYQQKPKLDARTIRLKKVIDQTEKELTDLEDRLKGIEGVSALGEGWLFYLTTSSIFVVGWLFSIYARERLLDSDDWLSYVISSIQIAFKSTSQGLGILGPIISFWGLIFVLTLIAASVRYLEKRLSPQKPPEQGSNSEGALDLNIDIGAGIKTSFSSEYKKGDFFHMWMKIFPIVLIMGTIFFIIIGLNYNTDSKEFSASLSGQLAGVALASIATGLMYIYIFFVIEKRRKANTAISFWKINFELFASTIGLLLFVPVSFLFERNELVAIIAFGFVLIFFGLVMGYAIYFRSIRTRQWELKTQISDLNYEVEKNLVPTPLYALKSDGYEFRNHMALIQDQIYQLLQYKNHQTLEATSGINRNPQKVIQSFWGRVSIRTLRRIYKSLATRVAKTLSDQSSTFTHAENQMLPQFKIMIDELKERRLFLNEELEPLQSRYYELNEGGTDRVKSLRNKIDEINTKIIEIEALMPNLIKAQEVCFQNVEQAIIRQQYSLRDGYDLGLWQRRNGMDFKPPLLLH